MQMPQSKIFAQKQSNLFYFIFFIGLLIFASLVKDFVFWLWSYGYELQLLKLIVNNDGTWDDSWGPMYEAAWVYVFKPDSGLYQTIFFDYQTKFQYPPISILPFIPLIKLDVEVEDFCYYMGYVSIFMAIVTGYIVYRLAVIANNRIFDDQSVLNLWEKAALFFILFVGTLTFYPIVYGVWLGQIQVMLDLVICLAMLAWVSDKKQMSGVLVAFAALIKPQFLLFLLWSLIRKEHKFTLGMVAVFVPAGIVSLAVFGFDEHLAYVSVLSFIGQHGEVYWPNQSMNGLLNRLLSGLNTLQFSVEEFAPYNPAVYFGTVITTAALVLFALLYRAIKPGEVSKSIQKRNSVLDFGTMLVVATIASPIAWEHHYGVTWPVIIIAFMAAIEIYRNRPTWLASANLIFMGASYFLISNYFYFINKKVSLSLPPWNLVQSYMYYGGLILLVSLIISRKLISDAASSRTGNFKDSRANVPS